MSSDQPDPQFPRSFRLGEWLVEPSLNRVSRGGASVQLELKVMEVLVCLARHAGSVVPQREIIDAVWQTEFISVNTLTQAIAQLRRVFGDEARNPRVIETITKRGYRLMVPVEKVVDEDACGPGSAWIIAVEGREIVLAPGESLIGRTADVVVRINDLEVSRHHARLTVGADGVTLEDLGSKNGTRLAGEPIAGPTRLESGDQITIGPAVLVLVEHTSDETTRTSAGTGDG